MTNLKDNQLSFPGKIVQMDRGIHCKVMLDNGVEVDGHISGKLQQRRIRLNVGDSVVVVFSTYDLTNGIITLPTERMEYNMSASAMRKRKYSNQHFTGPNKKKKKKL